MKIYKFYPVNLSKQHDEKFRAFFYGKTVLILRAATVQKLMSFREEVCWRFSP